MARIVFYEKPGCGGNAKQRAWLEANGHALEVRDLGSWPWTRDSLLAFLGPLPVADWFNRAARRVRSSEIVPERLDADTALALLLEEPLLIRRPLMVLEDGSHLVGFDETMLDAQLGRRSAARPPREGCAHPATPCTPSAAP